MLCTDKCKEVLAKVVLKTKAKKGRTTFHSPLSPPGLHRCSLRVVLEIPSKGILKVIGGFWFPSTCTESSNPTFFGVLHLKSLLELVFSTYVRMFI